MTNSIPEATNIILQDSDLVGVTTTRVSFD